MNNISFQQGLKYEFKNFSLLENALTHSSYTYEKNLFESNERLEFLGDAILDAVISEFLFLKLPHYEEGQLSKLRASVVCEKSLARCGKSLKVDEVLYLGRGEDSSGGRFRDSIIADAMEAIIGAIFLDGGFESAKIFVLRHFEEIIYSSNRENGSNDYKSRFQEMLQKSGNVEILYKIEKEEGPEHNKTFFASVYVANTLRGRGVGKNKKEAEQQAAKNALEDIQGGTANVF